jgi:hypothetical protein
MGYIKIQNMMILTGRFRVVLFIIFLGFAVAGCAHNEWAEKEQKEKELIAAYVEEHGITEEQMTDDGIYYIEEVAGTGLSPGEDDYVVIN